MQIELIYKDRNFFIFPHNRKIVQTEPFKMGFLIKNIDTKPTGGFTLKDVQWESADGKNSVYKYGKTFHVDTLEPGAERRIWGSMMGTYTYGLCNIKLTVTHDNADEDMLTFRKDPFTKFVTSNGKKNEWIDSFFIKSKSEHEQSQMNSINLCISLILLFMTVATWKLATEQTEYTRIQSTPEIIHQTQAKQRALEFCKKNPGNKNSGLNYLNGTGEEITCPDLLLLEKSGQLQ